MLSVIVTGGAGFLGSHIALRHLSAGDRVLCLDNFSTCLGSPSSPSPHFRRMVASSSFSWRACDVSDPFLLGSLFDWEGDIIYNFACPASPPRYQAMPVQTMMTCVAGTRNMLEVARRTGARLVHASTSEVYGDPTVTPQTEAYRGNVNPYGPRACYDEGKRAAEALCYDYRVQHGVDARLVRIFNTYGPHMDPTDGRVVSNFICEALRPNGRLLVHGDGRQTRSFCYVDDLVDAIVSLGAVPENPGMPINVGNPEETSVLELAAIVSLMVRGTARLDAVGFGTLPEDDPMQRRPDISVARRLLGWAPRWSLQDGLWATVEYFRALGV